MSELPSNRLVTYCKLKDVHLIWRICNFAERYHVTMLRSQQEKICTKQNRVGTLLLHSSRCDLASIHLLKPTYIWHCWLAGLMDLQVCQCATTSYMYLDSYYTEDKEEYTYEAKECSYSKTQHRLSRLYSKYLACMHASPCTNWKSEWQGFMEHGTWISVTVTVEHKSSWIQCCRAGQELSIKFDRLDRTQPRDVWFRKRPNRPKRSRCNLKYSCRHSSTDPRLSLSAGGTTSFSSFYLSCPKRFLRWSSLSMAQKNSKYSDTSIMIWGSKCFGLATTDATAWLCSRSHSIALHLPPNPERLEVHISSRSSNSAALRPPSTSKLSSLQTQIVLWRTPCYLRGIQSPSGWTVPGRIFCSLYGCWPDPHSQRAARVYPYYYRC